MRGRLSSILIKLLILFVGLQGAGNLLSAQAAVPTSQELDQLLAPVALYPDALLSQITTASTSPQEILDVHAWLQTNPGSTGAALTDAAEKQGFDPAFIALVNFPQVLEMMAQHVDDYAAIGRAFTADQGSVTASIQRLRAQAYNSGALRTTEQQKVEVQQSAGQTIYGIQPANPTVVYVPVYDPTVVYVRPVPGAVVTAPMVTFHVGIGIVPLIVDNRPWGWSGWGWNWRGRRAYYNHGYWNGWGNPYRPARYWYRPRPIVWANRPGYRGDWGYRPPNYRPPHYQPIRYPAPEPRRPGNPPGGNHPSPGKPGIPGKPANPNPPKPAPDRPPGRPHRPETPSQPDRGRTGPGRPTTPGENQPTRPDQRQGNPNQPGAAPQPVPKQPKTGQPNGGDSNSTRPDQRSRKTNRSDAPQRFDSNMPGPSRQRNSGQSGQLVRPS